MNEQSRWSDRRVPALVLGGPSHTTLGVIRALASAGIPQFVAGGRASFVAHSRWYRPLPAGLAEPRPGRLAAWLSTNPIDRAVLVPCSDDWVADVAHLEPDVASRFPASVAPADAVDTCLDKGSDAIAPPPPGLSWMTSGWPRNSGALSMNVRRTRSLAPPAPKGTTIVTGLVGYCCASVSGASTVAASPMRAIREVAARRTLGTAQAV